MSRLVVVSNRVGNLSNPAQTGGLAVAISEAIKGRGGIWFGWDGVTDDSGDGTTTVDTVGSVQTILNPMQAVDYEAFYLGFANSVIWPLFHYRADLVRFQQDYYEGYLRVNEQFANALMPHLKSDDLVWIHDYHFMSFGTYLRNLGCDSRIGFFLHIPFPGPDLLAALPNHAGFIEDLLQYDVVGFQTSADVANFKRCVEEFTSAEVDETGLIRFHDRTCVAERFPIGIDVDSFQEMAASKAEAAFIDAFKHNLVADKQMIGVDRLDYSKGIPARFQAFAQMLTRYPEMSKKVSFLQIAPPSRGDIGAYAEIREELERLSGMINGAHADFDWTPIRYIHRSVSRDRLAAMLRASEVGLVTPMRDGMNLVAKEYVAAQDPEDPGVLVLSRFAGAAEEMPEALLVNPFDIDEMAEMYFQALNMPLEERKERHRALFERIRRYDVKAWQESFLEALTSPREWAEKHAVRTADNDSVDPNAGGPQAPSGRVPT
ncbi:trehalose-6-phosphate synthase [Tianweitania populi]|uniref:Alpha,alpha-trehalose-phosphate synthase (UDP-forming) n=1 Tax=Tianweitania populi TaxID=1607949 RepID=A0A8J3DXB8_9HYPH|nr:trehalose-6-phosphate synthase [Tianweitania populi]GHD09708.1 alpha,alpha-trehalose-phosphate synthase (UDP-forming) [Tianweitania populi]